MKKKKQEIDIGGKWIWKRKADFQEYNQSIIARKSFTAGSARHAVIKITADSWYRLYVNGEWINDGPCRSWPEHYRYDELDISPYLIAGKNIICVIARYFGCGTFRQVSVTPGLLAELTLSMEDGSVEKIHTDRGWEVSDFAPLLVNTPKACIQMEAFEIYDARKESFKYGAAVERFGASEGPWKNLRPRDVKLLTQRPFSMKSFCGANIVGREYPAYTFPLARINHPGIIESNGFTSNAGAVAAIIHSDRNENITIKSDSFAVTVNGQKAENNIFKLHSGENLVLGVVMGGPPHCGIFGHRKEAVISFPGSSEVSLRNVLDPKHENPWCHIPFEESRYRRSDIEFATQKLPEKEKIAGAYKEAADQMLERVKDRNSLMKEAAGRMRQYPAAEMLLENPYEFFINRKVGAPASDLIDNPYACMGASSEATVIRPSPDGDIELVFDLGEQNIGYYSFDISAAAGTVLDIFEVEYISPEGKVQHTLEYRNGMRYVCKDGRNKFVSLKRRSGRYIFITIRRQRSPVEIRNIGLIESTYPVGNMDSFSCSDDKLNRIWDISARTLKLCMEDTFTDCPLYEQTLWLADARNEAVFALGAFGSEDIVKRSIRLGGESLERLPMTGCQVPSTWDVIIPVVSFSWGLMAWDYYWHSGDRKFLRESYGWLRKNIDGARDYINDDGLFEAPFWNFFDWTDIDDKHRIVLHNSFLYVAAIDSAMKCAGELGRKADIIKLKKLRASLSSALNRQWNSKMKSYPDSIHEDGLPGTKCSQHTSLMSLLLGIAAPSMRKHALENVLRARKDMARFGTPYVMLFAYELFEQLGMEKEILASIRKEYAAMLSAGATTVWETFGQTRSHAHGWSSLPLYYYPRLILGIHQSETGGGKFIISPRISGLDHACGRVATANGGLSVAWKKHGKKLEVLVNAPENTSIKFKRNNTMYGYSISFRKEKRGANSET
ncbi:MAG: family 78 glycoside hydrolase catalytic domain [Victivallales bacterium]